MTSEWQYQVRFDVGDLTTAESIRQKRLRETLAALFDVLDKYNGAPKCQYDAFADYVAAAEAEGIEHYPLYDWTKQTIENPAKREKYLKSFTVYVQDRDVYDKKIADGLEADLQPFASSGLISHIAKYDTNPANNPQPPTRRERR